MTDRTYSTDDFEDELEWEDNAPSYDEELDFDKYVETEYLPDEEDVWTDNEDILEDE